MTVESPETTIPTGGLIDSAVAAEMLGITKNNLRQLVNKKRLHPQGRQNRRSLFAQSDVEALRQTREAKARKTPVQE